MTTQEKKVWNIIEGPAFDDLFNMPKYNLSPGFTLEGKNYNKFNKICRIKKIKVISFPHKIAEFIGQLNDGTKVKAYYDAKGRKGRMAEYDEEAEKQMKEKRDIQIFALGALCGVSGFLDVMVSGVAVLITVNHEYKETGFKELKNVMKRLDDFGISYTAKTIHKGSNAEIDHIVINSEGWIEDLEGNTLVKIFMEG